MFERLPGASVSQSGFRPIKCASMLGAPLASDLFG